MALKAEEVYAMLKKQIQSGGATPEQIQAAVDAYLEENPVQPGATEEQAAQIENNKADISSVKEDVSSLSEEINKIVDDNYYTIKTNNLLPPGDVIYGKSISQIIGSDINEFYEVEDNAIYPVIKGIEIGEKYSTYINERIEKYGGLVGYYDENGKLLSFSNNRNIVIPEKCTQVRISNIYSRGIITQFKKGTSETTEIEEYNGNYYSYIPKILDEIKKLNTECSIQEKMNYIYVSVDGSDETGDGTKEKPFATIYHANDIINDASKLNRYTILVSPGTYYDLQEKYSGVKSEDHYQGVITKDYVYYESESKNPNDTIIVWDGKAGIDSPTLQDIVSKCPFHVVLYRYGETHVKGFKFITKNLRYGLHCESSGFGNGGKWEVDNCIIDWQGCEDCVDDNGNVPAIGIGMSPGECGIIKSCKISTLTSQSILVHDGMGRYNDNAIIYGSTLNIQNSDIGTGRLQFQSIYPKSGELNAKTNNICNVTNCTEISSLYSYISSLNQDNEMVWRLYAKDCSIKDTGNMGEYVFKD